MSAKVVVELALDSRQEMGRLKGEVTMRYEGGYKNWKTWR